jgi:cytidine deaminase
MIIAFHLNVFYICLLFIIIFMKQVKIEIPYDVLSIDELSEEVHSLIDAACDATKGSYAPFSKFHVGAAVLLDNGVVVLGSNQENSAFPSGLCAERTALFSAGANYPGHAVRALAIAAETGGSFLQEPITPCGACCQVLSESEHRAGTPIDIYLYGEAHVFHLRGVRSLLPFAFSL